jgi:hypothetical protein
MLHSEKQTLLMFLKNKLQIEAHVPHPFFLLIMKRMHQYLPRMFAPHIKALMDLIISAKIVCQMIMWVPYLNIKAKFLPTSKNCMKKKIKPI